jgi:DNA-binding IscR family transcriptional regulator
VHVPAKVAYGLRALLSLAAAGSPQTAEQLAADQGLPRGSSVPSWPSWLVASHDGSAAHLQEVWVAVRASLRQVLERVTVGDIASGKLPHRIERLTADPDAWQPH